MSRTRLILFARCAGLLILSVALSTAAHAYQQPDLQGRWESNSIASGPGAPWWERVLATISPSGSFTALTNDNSGGSGVVLGTLNLSPSGIVERTGVSTFRAALDQGTTVLAGTDTWSGVGAGTTELRVSLKMAPTYALSDIVGTWEINSLASGPGAPWWQRGRVAVAANGSFSGTFIDSDGFADPTAGTFALSPSGILTYSGSATARGVLDVGKTVLAMTSTWSGFAAGTVDLSVGVKVAASYTLADLVGTWDVNGLATGPGAPWWTRSHITIAADGSFTSSNTESNGGTFTTSGTFSISPTGVITRSGSSSARGVLDADKTVMVWTSLWSTGSPGTTQMDVATKTGGVTLHVPRGDALGLALEPVRPNPTTRGTLHVAFTLASAAGARLELFDVNGRRVAIRELGLLGAGQHAVVLTEASRLRAGLYLMRLSQGEASRNRRIVVLE